MKFLHVFFIIGVLTGKLWAMDPPSTHGMLMFGQEKLYAHHLPMFHRPHDYQVLFEIGLPEEVQTQYLKLLRRFPEQTVYTLVPERFSLPQKVIEKTPFKAVLYFGHFERGGQAVSAPFDVTIKKVLYFKKLDPQTPRQEELEYLHFGTSSEQFISHLITRRPDFDQIIQIKPLPLERETQVLVVKKSDPLKPLPQAVPLEWTILQELYLEFGDLSH